MINNEVTITINGKQYECKINNDFAKYMDRRVGIHQAGHDLERNEFIPPLSLVAEIIGITLVRNGHDFSEDELYQLLCDYMRSAAKEDTNATASLINAAKSILMLCIPPPIEMPERKETEAVDAKK